MQQIHETVLEIFVAESLCRITGLQLSKVGETYLVIMYILLVDAYV